MAAIVFPINPENDPLFVAENGVQYKWEKDGTSWGAWRALGSSAPGPEPEPEPQPDPVILPPDIILPIPGSVDLEPDIILVATDYNDDGTGAGPHESSDWEVYEASEAEVTPETSAILSVDLNNEIGNWAWGNAKVGNWMDVAYGNGIYVAIQMQGENQIMHSEDGVTWTYSKDIPFKNYSAITYGEPVINGVVTPRFVAVASSGLPPISYSDDGITWKDVTSVPAFDTYVAVTFANGQYVAVGNAGYTSTNHVLISPDGLTWTAANTSHLAGVTNFNSVSYADGVWIISGGGSYCIQRSTNNGLTWSQGYVGFNFNKIWMNPTYSNGVWVVGNADTSPMDGGFLYSTDGGEIWEFEQGAYRNQTAAPLLFDGTRFIAYAKASDKYQYSTDGIEWTEGKDTFLNVTNGWSAMVLGDDKIVAVSFGSPYAGYSKFGVSVTLNLTDEKAYNEADNKELTTIDQAFKDGDMVMGGVGITGVLTEDADEVKKTIELTDVTGDWEKAVTAINDTRTIQLMPGAPTTEPPDASVYTKVVDSVGDTTNLQTYELDDTVIKADKAYYSRVKYNDDGSTGSTISSDFSDYNEFVAISSDGDNQVMYSIA